MLHGGSLCAANPAVQRQMLEVLAGARADQGPAGSEKASR